MKLLVIAVLILIVLIGIIFLIPHSQEPDVQYNVMSKFRERIELNIPICEDMNLSAPYRGYLICGENISFNWFEYSKHGIGFRSTSMPLANLNSIKDLGNDFAVDKNHVYFQGKLVDEADPNTFYRLIFNTTAHNNQTKYSMDINNIFYENQKLPGVLPSEFKYFGVDYSAGSNTVFFKNNSFLEANPSSFELVGCAYWYSKDNNFVFFNPSSGVEPIIIRNADPKTFKIVYCNYYTLDSNYVYYVGNVVPGADPSTFEVFYQNPAYGKDANHYYSGATEVSKSFVENLIGTPGTYPR